MEKTVYQRWLYNTLTGPISQNKVRLIFGARQTGKTVLLHQLLPEGRSRIYNLQDTSLRQSFERDPSAFSRELKALPDRITHIAVDEIQKVPALLDEIQYLYDENPSHRQFFLTGSSARKLRTHSANLLAGRCHVYHLFPVIRLEESHSQGNIPIPGEKTGSPSFPERSLADRLLLGNLPGVRQEKTGSAIATLEAYVENYLEEEIRREGLVRNLGAFQVFLKLSAIESGGQTNLSKLSQESGIPSSTLKTFYQVLVDTFVGYWIHSYSRSERKRLLTTPRFLFFDLGVRNASAQIPPDNRILTEVGGRLIEQWVGIELLQRAYYAGRGYSVSFWRTVSGAEVDFVWQSPTEDIPIEVKWSENPQAKDARHIETFLDLYPKRSKRGIIICRVPRPQQITDRIMAIPWQEL